MQSIEMTGKTVEEATQAAAAKLGVSADKIKVTVLEESKGLFGKSQFRIQADVADSAPTPKEEKEEKSAKPAKKPAAKAPAKKSAKATAEEAEPVAAEAPAPAAEPDGEAQAEAIATEEDAEQLIEFMHHLLETGDLEVELKVKEISGKYITISIDGKDVSHLMGRQGEVLNSLQSLINIMIGRKLNKGFRATLDSGDFRAKREAKLEKLAEELAAEVIKRQEEAVLDALPAFERRVVHKALQKIEGVATYSEGEEPNRHVVIAPKGDLDSDD